MRPGRAGAGEVAAEGEEVSRGAREEESGAKKKWGRAAVRPGGGGHPADPRDGDRVFMHVQACVWLRTHLLGCLVATPVG